MDFISQYVQLKKSGQNWKGLCPFHSEKTPSFMVSPSKQIFHCFGCSAGGDVIAFASKYENLSFNEAVSLLAGKAGIPLSSLRTDKKAVERDENLRNALLEACRYFMKKLGESGPAEQYLRHRGVSKESIEAFRVGFAPAGWNNLLRHLRTAGYSDLSIKEAGLAVAGDKGVYDMFRQRLIFPISNISGNVIAFGGRAMDDSAPKYINSPETAVFRKSETLFGLSHAKESIRRENSVIIVEGYMDVIICHQYGFRNAVAPLGTSLTSGHVQKLRTLTNKAVLVFDGDSAGRAAAKRALPLICQNNYKARVLLLPDKEDPDSFLCKQGSESFRSLLTKATTMIDFILDISGGEKADTVREAVALAAAVTDPLIADEMLIELSDRTRISETTIREEFGKLKSRAVSNIASRRGPDCSVNDSEGYQLLRAVVAFPEKSDYVLARLNVGDIRDKTVVSLFKKLESLRDRKDFACILDTADEEERRMVTRFSVDPGFDTEHVDKNIEDCFRRIEARKLDEKIRLAQITGDVGLMNALLLEKKKFIKETGA